MPIEDLKVKPEILSPKPPSIATDEEFASGTSTTASPTVKQCKEKLVTTDTNQLITGFKAFNNGSGNNRTNIDIITNDGVGEDANVKWAGSIQFKKGDEFIGFCEALKDRDNNSVAQIVAHKSVNGQSVYSLVQTVVTSDGTAYGLAPSAPANAPPNAIVTKDKIANMVTTNTIQTITGKKTFTNSAPVTLLDSAARLLTLKSTVYDITAPAAGQYYGILDFRDKNDYQVGRIDIFIPSTTEQVARIGCKNAAGNWSFLQAGWKNGVAYATAPTSSVATNNTQIATTAYVNAKLQVVSTLPANPDPNVFYFIPE